jgi:hypothetical protein
VVSALGSGVQDHAERVGDQVGGRGEQEQVLVALALGMAGGLAFVQGLALGPDLLLGDLQLLEGEVELGERQGQRRLARPLAAGLQPQLPGAILGGVQVPEKGLVVHRRLPSGPA